MLSLQTSYAKAINKRYDRVGHLFQEPLKSIHIDRDEYLLYLSRYIHINPVIAELVPKPEDWPFSSLRMALNPDRVPNLSSRLGDKRRFLKIYLEVCLWLK